jgi:hypothetical protein
VDAIAVQLAGEIGAKVIVTAATTEELNLFGDCGDYVCTSFVECFHSFFLRLFELYFFSDPISDVSFCTVCMTAIMLHQQVE